MSPRAVNLLPVKYRRANAVRRLSAFWTSLGIVTLVGCAMAVAWEHVSLWGITSKVEQLRTEAREVESTVAGNTVLRERLADLQFLNQHLGSLAPSDDLLQTLGLVAHISGEQAGEFPRVRRLRIDLRHAKVPASWKASAAKTKGDSMMNTSTQLSITLLGQNQQQIQQWMSRLSAQPRVTNVQLGRSGIDATTGGFELEVQAAVLVEREVP